MTEDVIVSEAERLVKVTLNGVVLTGQPIAHNGTNWVKADASDATTNLYAQYIAMETGESGDIITACKGCSLYDSDAPYTANTTLYVSATAGELTHTRPTAAADVIQIVGRSIDTYRARIDIIAPWELEDYIQVSGYNTTAEVSLGVIDSPLWVGPGIDTNVAPEDVYFTDRFPSGVISVLDARVVYNSIAATTSWMSAALITCVDGGTNTGDTGTAHSAALPTSIADSTLCYSDITAMFDAGALKANYNFTVAVTAGTTTFTGDLQVLGLYMRYLVV